MVQRRTRSDHAVRCVTDLIDHMILETQVLYKGTDMEDRCMLSTMRWLSETRVRHKRTSR